MEMMMDADTTRLRLELLKLALERGEGHWEIDDVLTEADVMFTWVSGIPAEQAA